MVIARSEVTRQSLSDADSFHAHLSIIAGRYTREARPDTPRRQAAAVRATLTSAASNRRATSFAIETGVAANPITRPFILGVPG
jgi:hypothetical protein